MASKLTAAMKTVSSILKKRSKPLESIGILVIVLIPFLTGCATVSKYAEYGTVSGPAALFDGDIFIFADIQACYNLAALALSKDGASSKQIEKIAAGTQYLYAAVSGNSTEEVTLSGAVAGAFPSGLLRLGLSFDRDWRARRPRVNPQTARWWKYNASGFQIAAIGSEMLFFSTSDLSPLLERAAAGDAAENYATQIVGKWAEERDFIVFLRDPLSVLPTEIPSVMMKGSTALVLGSVEEEAVRLDLLLEFDSDSQARIGGLLLRTLILAESRNGADSPLFSARVRVEGTTTVLESVIVKNEIVLDFLGTTLDGYGDIQ
ncbi:MAG: hypothetical protein HN368_14370 [Spirochaetales bacterium]|jgi:hypothetical protein|nr:hypothetical protein [Spirochaetales bacterium]